MSSTRSVKSPGPWAADASTTIPGSPLSGVPYRRTSVVTADAREGWPFDTLVDSAKFNELMYRYTTLMDIMDRQGVLGWSDQVDYAVPAIAFGSDGVLYRALLASGPTTTARDPISNPTYWQSMSAEVQPFGFKNLALSASGTSANITITADQIVVDGASGSRRLSAVSLTVAGTSVGANALDAGTIAANTWYSVWVIWNGTTTAGLMSTSAASPTLPATYTHKARVGWIRTDGTGNKHPLSFVQRGRTVQYVSTPTGNLANALPVMASGVTGGGSLTSLAVSAFVPTTAASISVTVSGSYQNNGGTVSPSASYAAGIAANASPIYLSANAAVAVGLGASTSMVLESSNIWWSATGSTYIICTGWEDNL